MAKKKQKTPCDLGQHILFDTLGGDQLCALCGFRKEGAAAALKEDKRKSRAMLLAAMEGDDAELLALLEDDDEDT